MEISLFLMLVAVVLLLVAAKPKGSLSAKLIPRKVPTRHLHTAVSALILTAQVSELVKVIEHISIVNISAALLLLAVVVATKSGTEGELH